MSELTVEQQQFVTYRLSGMTTEEAAKALGITTRTGYRWMRYPRIKDALSIPLSIQEERTAAEIISSKYREKLEATCDAVVNIALNEDAPENVRLRAAQMIQDRLAPAELPQPEQQSGPVSAELLPFVSEEELGLIDQILERAKMRKQEAETKITPMRRTE